MDTRLFVAEENVKRLDVFLSEQTEEFTRSRLKKLIEIAQNWRGKKWGYIADISKLQTVSTEVSSVLVNLHTEIFENGCSCVGFVEPINAFISRQAAVHNRLSDAELQEGHFHDFDEAFNWAKNIISS